MTRPVGRNIAISPFRRLVIDLMHFSQKVPSVTIERRLKLAKLVDARQACMTRPTWYSLFTKAYAIVAARTPELRRSYLRYPWPHIYEHPRNLATLNLERKLGDEKIVIYAMIRGPENRSIEELDGIIRWHKNEPLENIGSFQRAMRLARLPFPIRRFVWWGSLNFFGRLRCHNYGTFGITSTASIGAGVQHIIPILTSSLHYSLFDDAGTLEMRLSFDHRVLDGATAAQALVDLESVLLHEILDEVRGLPAARLAA
jgi:hypothetical protein